MRQSHWVEGDYKEREREREKDNEIPFNQLKIPLPTPYNGRHDNDSFNTQRNNNSTHYQITVTAATVNDISQTTMLNACVYMHILWHLSLPYMVNGII